MDERSPEARLVRLESQIAENEKTIADLNEVVQKQWAEIDRLKSQIEAVSHQVGRLAGTVEDLEIKEE